MGDFPGIIIIAEVPFTTIVSFKCLHILPNKPENEENLGEFLKLHSRLIILDDLYIFFIGAFYMNLCV